MTTFINSLAIEAGKKIILPAFHKIKSNTLKKDGSIVTETDLQCQHYLQKRLQKAYPHIAFLGEEMQQKEQVNIMKNDHYWCVDPLDGTSNFASNIPLFSTSIALISNGQPTHACIYQPYSDEIFTTSISQPKKRSPQDPLNNKNSALQNAIGYIDFKRLNTKARDTLCSHMPYRSQRNLGSCALEWAWLAKGRGDFIIHGNENLWDYAAGILLAERAGCIISDFNGNHPFATLRLNSPIIAANSHALHKDLLALLQ
ncbi:MAG: inositol monophosphatase [Zetaproteobacteria bacterium]|nr:inositol monophosphatase [Zetaproteobacteria bacterium]